MALEMHTLHAIGISTLPKLEVRCFRYMGLGSEWNQRWCVIMPRFPSVAAPANQQLTRSLLVIYKASTSFHLCMGHNASIGRPALQAQHFVQLCPGTSSWLMSTIQNTSESCNPMHYLYAIAGPVANHATFCQRLTNGQQCCIHGICACSATKSVTTAHWS